MRLQVKLFYLLSTMVAVSCIKETPVTETEGSKELSIKLEEATQTRTWIDGNKDGESVPLYWSEGDRINANGIESAGLSIADAETRISDATFKIININPPYNVLYPAELYKGIHDGLIQVKYPVEQKYTTGTFSDDLLLMAGHSETESITLKPACGVIKFRISDEDCGYITNVTLKSLSSDSHVAGDFSVDPKTGEMTIDGEGSNIIRLQLPEEGVQLSPTRNTVFFFVVPAGTYPDGFEIKTTDSNGNAMRRYWLRSEAGANPGVTVKAGRMYRFDNGEYVPDAKEICSTEDWADFVTRCATDNPETNPWISRDGYAHIGADFIVEGAKQQFEIFSAKINGNGHTITFPDASLPLVKTLTGTIKDLRLAGKMTASDPASQGTAAFCSTLSGGTLTGCTNAMEISVADNKAEDAVRASGLVHSFRGGLIERCVNEGDITVNTIMSGNKIVTAGGIVGIVEQLASEAVITGCTNKGNISLTLDFLTKDSYKPYQAGYGGIVGVINDGTAEKKVCLSFCKNNGAISVYHKNTTNLGPQKSASGAGGIIGMNYRTESGAFTSGINSGFHILLDNCTNNGSIYNGSMTNTDSQLLHKAYSGGLAGILFGASDSHILVTDCSNSGNIYSYKEDKWLRPGLSSVCGGLCGLAGWVDVKRCSVMGAMIGSDSRLSYAVSGCFGIAVRSFSAEDCSFDVDLRQIRCKLSGEGLTDGNTSLIFSASSKAKKGNIGGTATNYNLDFTGTSIKNCTFKGSITTNESLIEWNNQAFSTYPAMVTTTLDADNFDGYIVAKNTDSSQITKVGNTCSNEQ